MSADKIVLSKPVEAEHSEGAAADITIIDEELLRNKVYEIRGQKVMLDFELAEIYGYTTSRFNEQVHNNISKFEGDDFMFQLSSDEFADLMSKKTTSNRGGRRKRPYAFTESGVYMLMTVLKGELATKQSRALIRLFKRMKDYVVENQPLLGQRDFLMLSMQVSNNAIETLLLRRELNKIENDVAAAIAELGEVVHKSEIGSFIEQIGEAIERYGFLLLDGHPVEAAAAYASIYELARESVFIVDNYVGPRTLELLACVPDGTKVTLFTDNKGRRLHASDVIAFQGEYPSIEFDVRSAGGFVHDRYVILDYGLASESVFHCGGSSKDAGIRMTSIVREEHPELFQPLIERLLDQPALELP